MRCANNHGMAGYRSVGFGPHVSCASSTIRLSSPASAHASPYAFLCCVLCEQKFFNMNWVDKVDDSEADACVLIGEENDSDGKAWFVCNEPASSPDMECESVAAYGNVNGGTQEEFLCKTPKVSS